MFSNLLLSTLTAALLSTSAIAAETKTPAPQSPTQKSTPAATPTSSAKVNINTASAAELMALKGMSASKAKAIVSYRKKQGDIKSLDDLKQIKGFKRLDEAAMKQIQDQLSVA